MVLSLRPVWATWFTPPLLGASEVLLESVWVLFLGDVAQPALLFVFMMSFAVSTHATLET